MFRVVIKKKIKEIFTFVKLLYFMDLKLDKVIC